MMRAPAAYLPLDIQTPAGVLRHLVDKLQIRLIVIQPSLKEVSQKKKSRYCTMFFNNVTSLTGNRLKKKNQCFLQYKSGKILHPYKESPRNAGFNYDGIWYGNRRWAHINVKLLHFSLPMPFSWWAHISKPSHAKVKNANRQYWYTCILIDVLKSIEFRYSLFEVNLFLCFIGF